MSLYTLPFGGQVIETRVAEEPVQARSVQIPILWAGGPVGPLTLKIQGGYARWTALAGADAWHSVGARTDLVWELPLGPLTTSAGVTAQQWFPVGPAPIRTMPGAYGLTAGGRFALLGLLDLEASVWGLPDPEMNNLLGGATGRAWGASAVVRIGL
ncbi:MAG: hypothetical protein VKO64_08165 [Candidatus Sericytochromatia bacterium]|nr:hypothetical protein [Candidatus Sericytochromatia bacterium]